MHEAVLAEILEERGASSRGRRVPRGVERRMSWTCPLAVEGWDQNVMRLCA